jgi:coenzyme F420-reducing hydrogenase delta subunit/ferredoxin
MENSFHNKEEYQPKVLVFACNWCSYAGADMAGVSRLQMPPNCRVVRVMCSARVGPEMVLSALFKGMDAVLVLGCHPGDCHYSEGNFYTRRRALVLEKLLDLLGIAKERFQVRWVSAAEGEKFAKTIREVVDQITRLGPNPSSEKFFGGPGGDFSKKPPGRRRQYNQIPGQEEMEDKLKKIAGEFLQQPDVECFIGYETSPDGSVRPVFIRSPGEVDRLVWNRECFANLAAYLPNFREKEGIVGIAVKGCDARSLRELIRSRQVDRSKIYIVGLPCTDKGLRADEGDGIAERCFGCVFPENFEYDAVLGPMEIPGLPPRAGDSMPGGLSFEERFAFWEKEIEKCISCNACRKICYGCFCPECIFESVRPRWVTGRRSLGEKFFFHSVRAFHLVGRCIECGECERACPAGVRLMLLNKQLQRDIENLFGCRGIGVTEEPPPLLTFSKDDPDPFSGGHE